VSGTDGATSLTPEQQEWFLRNYGVRYLGVQTNADVPSRRARRAHKRTLRRRPGKGRLYGIHG
jgi:hypothetical protein